MSQTDPLEARLEAKGLELGFSSLGIAAARQSDHREAYERWIEAGHHGEMGYLAREDARARRYDPSLTLEGVRSAIVVLDPYASEDAPGVPDDPSIGVIARYARGRDYHKVIPPRLRALHEWLEAEAGHPVSARGYTDTGPLLEREWARRAGLGWFGRNTMLIDPLGGSYFFIGVLLVDLDLTPSGPFEADRCGTCNACVEACPTGALLGRDETGAPVIDARRCISYLTIEHRGSIPEELRPLIGNRVFGCDICQEVCPWNRFAGEEVIQPGFAARGPGEGPVGVEGVRGPTSIRREDVSAETRSGTTTTLGATTPSGATTHPGTASPSLVELLTTALDEVAWDVFSRGSAIRRAGRVGFARNVCVALGNWGSEEAVPVLRLALDDADPLVREHAAWALRRVASAGGAACPPGTA